MGDAPQTMPHVSFECEYEEHTLCKPGPVYAAGYSTPLVTRVCGCSCHIKRERRGNGQFVGRTDLPPLAP